MRRQINGLCDRAKWRVVEDVRFEGAGCAISVASASLMTEAIKGKSVEAGRKTI